MNERSRTRQRPGDHTTVAHTHRGQVVNKEETQGPLSPNLRDDQQPWAKVRIGGGVTRNMGDFNGIRVDVSIEMACENNWDAVNALTDELSEYVEDRIISEMDKAMGE